VGRCIYCKDHNVRLFQGQLSTERKRNNGRDHPMVAKSSSGKVLEFKKPPAHFEDERPPVTTPKKMPRISDKTKAAEGGETGKVREKKAVKPAPNRLPSTATLEEVQETEEYQEAIARIEEQAPPTAEEGYQVVLGMDPSLSGTGMAWLESPSGDSLTHRIEAPHRSPLDDSHRAVGEILKGSVVPLGVRLDRLCSAVTIAVGDLWSPWPKLCVMEQPFTNPKTPQAGIAVAQAQTAALIALTRLYIPVVLVPPKTRAKFATGNGNAGKPDVLTAAVDQFGFKPCTGYEEDGTEILTEDPVKPDDVTNALWIKNYDRADAYILAVIGAFLLGESFEIPGLDLYDEQYEAIEKLPSFEEMLVIEDEEEPF
jgi:Holliday junction resolvasome RuvABC endonuclease subunit